MQKFNFFLKLVKQMGIKYLLFRSYYEFIKRTGIIKLFYQTKLNDKEYVSLDWFRKNSKHFFFKSKDDLTFPKNKSAYLENDYNKIRQGIITFFSSIEYDLGKEYDWVTNPETGFKYDIQNHWSEVSDFDSDQGDIKYVWEKSRFSYIYKVIRHDYHFEIDHSDFVFNEIKSWIKANPVNKGPNYFCSQEISIRVLNWIFALYYYKYSDNLTDPVFKLILKSIFAQIKHVRQNINFSRIAVKNNHAITECLTLYLVGLLFPDFPESKDWKLKGKKWFEREIAEQIYDDGTYLQYSMNYHRVVMQLLTWGIRISELNKEEFSPIVYKKAKKSLEFLKACQDPVSGWLPNYGANDGALFFQFTGCNFRNYKPQLNSLNLLLTDKQIENISNDEFEDAFWYGIDSKAEVDKVKYGFFSFDTTGYYIYKNSNTLTFLRCGKHLHRPSQADNNHLDIWIFGKNILHDSGSYKYNLSPELSKYFVGTLGHNTVQLEDFDQMKKGPRFIWFDWSNGEMVNFVETDNYIELTTELRAFKHISPKIVHTRKIMIYKNQSKWIVEDAVNNYAGQMKQLWHFFPEYEKNLRFKLIDQNDNGALMLEKAYASENYGLISESILSVFETKSSNLVTEIVYIEN